VNSESREKNDDRKRVCPTRESRVGERPKRRTWGKVEIMGTMMFFPLKKNHQMDFNDYLCRRWKGQAESRPVTPCPDR
jgi:hypothetical protein